MKRPTTDEHGAGQERDPPAPAQERGLARQRPARCANTLVERSRPAGTPICGHEPKKPRRPWRRVLDRHQHRAAPLAADADALGEAEHDEQDRREHADRRVGRQAADQERRDAHDQQRQHEHRLAADAVAEVAEHDPAERARGEADRVRAERQQRADQRLGVREEQLAEDQRRRRAVQEEVVPLDRRADEARQRDLPHGLRAVPRPSVLASLSRKDPRDGRTRQSGRPNQASESAPPASSSTIAPPAKAAVTSRSTSREESRVPRFA